MNLALIVALSALTALAPPPPFPTTFPPTPREPAPHVAPWTPGPRSTSDWSALIDQAWGDGVGTDTKLAVLDAFTAKVDEEFPCFGSIDDTWLVDTAAARQEVAQGVSRGRFAGILSRLSMSLRESHTRCRINSVEFMQPEHGIPLLLSSDLGDNPEYLGAAVTALDDGTGLVYEVWNDNPLGLAAGDIILGYDGRPWAECLDELLAAELPVSGWWGSTPSAWDHHWIAAVGANWHLFDTMDVIKHGTGETVHLSTLGVDGYNCSLQGTEQLYVGIPFPEPDEGRYVTYGVIDRYGLALGYVYVYAWSGTAGVDFHEAIDVLTSDGEIDGLIVDFRYNMGGNMHLASDALGLLFREPVTTIEWLARSNAHDHLALRSLNNWQAFIIDPTPAERFYDRPIAVLTGPGALSSGDQVALRMSMHPTARVFGKPTAGAFNSPHFSMPAPAFSLGVAVYEAAMYEAQDVPLTRVGFPVDEEVWLTAVDVARNIDTVVEAAAAWIDGAITAVENPGGGDTTPAAPTGFVGAYPNPFNPSCELVIDLATAAGGELSIHDLTGRRVRTFDLAGLVAGRHRLAWDGRSDAGMRLASGSYVVRLKTDTRVDSGRLTLVK